MSDRYVVGVDISTTAVKAIAWNREGRAVGEARARLPLQRPAAHRYEQHPADWRRALCASLKQLAQTCGSRQLTAIAIAHQRETVCAVDVDGEPLAPAILWLDQRARDEVAPLIERIGEGRLREITGKSADFGPALYKLAWLRDNQPSLFAAAHKFCDIQGWLVQQLTGVFATAWPSADPFGLFDLQRRDWSPELCAAVGLDPAQLCPAHAPGTILGHIDDHAAAATGLAAGTPVVAAGGDGQAAGLGVNALSSDRAYLNLGTAVVTGIYSAQPAVAADWRTLTSCAEQGFILESSLRSGALLSDWYLKRLCGIDPGADAGALATLEDQAASLPVGSDGLLLLPYWEGAMNPYWEMGARGCILGLSDAHRRAHIYRALIEGIALEQALFTAAVRAHTGIAPAVFAAIGGVARSDLWCAIASDVLNTPVERARAAIEATSLGAAMCAAHGGGWYATVAAAAAAMHSQADDIFHPDAGRAARYCELLAIYRDLFPAVRDIQGRLGTFAE